MAFPPDEFFERTTMSRLRILNEALREGLISTEEYESHKHTLLVSLSAMPSPAPSPEQTMVLPLQREPSVTWELAPGEAPLDDTFADMGIHTHLIEERSRYVHVGFAFGFDEECPVFDDDGMPLVQTEVVASPPRASTPQSSKRRMQPGSRSVPRHTDALLRRPGTGQASTLGLRARGAAEGRPPPLLRYGGRNGGDGGGEPSAKPSAERNRPGQHGGTDGR
ncbi:hypothetical protein T492DRAFT_880893 [Pavlovales sp. CCMP2436]|nr:hypothetical protein T492DRAFT_880893 [Pavlovales sp. CCMP2436]